MSLAAIPYQGNLPLQETETSTSKPMKIQNCRTQSQWVQLQYTPVPKAQ